MTEAAPRRLTERTFTAERTRILLEAACNRVALDADGAIVLRHHTNAVYQLVSAPVVVKIARPGIRHVPAIVQLTRWLDAHQVQSVPLFDGFDQPVEVGGCAVTFWRYLPQTRPLVAGDLAGPLSALHRMPVPALSLPDLDPILAIRRSLIANRSLTDHDQQRLDERCTELADRYADLQFDGSYVLLHGDPQHRNALWDDAAGHAVLCDWESAAFGPREWDLITIEVHCRRFRAHPAEYADFCNRYGYDIRSWPGYPVLRDIRELRMIATNARKAAPDSPQATEVRRRVAILDQGADERWELL